MQSGYEITCENCGYTRALTREEYEELEYRNVDPICDKCAYSMNDLAGHNEQFRIQALEKVKKEVKNQDKPNCSVTDTFESLMYDMMKKVMLDGEVELMQELIKKESVIKELYTKGSVYAKGYMEGYINGYRNI